MADFLALDCPDCGGTPTVHTTALSAYGYHSHSVVCQCGQNGPMEKSSSLAVVQWEAGKRQDCFVFPRR